MGQHINIHSIKSSPGPSRRRGVKSPPVWGGDLGEGTSWAQIQIVNQMPE